MLHRRKNQWLLKANRAEYPLLLHDLAPDENEIVILSFLQNKIISKELDGLITPDNKTFIPNRFIKNLISQQLNTEGIVDICYIIDKTNLSGEILEKKILENVQQIDGFFDLINRKFLTPWGSINELKNFIMNKPISDLKYLLNKLYWSEDHLEAVLDLMAQKGQFIGYIDPIKYKLHNFSLLDFSNSTNIRKNLIYLIRFVNTSFKIKSEASIAKISKLTGLNKENCIDLIEKYLQGGQFVFSSNHDYIYSSIDIIEQILKDLFVYREIPLEFWQQRLEVDRTNLINLLTVLNNYLNGTLTKGIFSVTSVIELFERGIDIEGLSSKLNLKQQDLLKRILKISNIFRLHLIAGETSDPFLVKGVKEFEIFCQVDTSTYNNPQLYFECQNCKRIMCSNCRTTGSKYECPFCGNISAFIIDLPRHCSRCKVTYTYSYNLLSTEECYFCKKGPLNIGWAKNDDIKMYASMIDPKLTNFIKNSTEREIPINKILLELQIPDSEAITVLEDSILHGFIYGRINIQKMVLERYYENEKIYCSVCEVLQSKLDKYRCTSCGVKVCGDCYKEMVIVRIILCPECGGELIFDEK